MVMAKKAKIVVVFMINFGKVTVTVERFLSLQLMVSMKIKWTVDHNNNGNILRVNGQVVTQCVIRYLSLLPPLFTRSLTRIKENESVFVLL